MIHTPLPPLQVGQGRLWAPIVPCVSPVLWPSVPVAPPLDCKLLETGNPLWIPMLYTVSGA